MHPSPVLLPGKSHEWRSLVGCSPWDCEKSDTTEWLHFHFSCIGERNGNPIQCSCLENPRDEGAWWAAVSGVAQSWTGLKPLSSSSSLRADQSRTLLWNELSVFSWCRLQGMGWTAVTYSACSQKKPSTDNNFGGITQTFSAHEEKILNHIVPVLANCPLLPV